MWLLGSVTDLQCQFVFTDDLEGPGYKTFNSYQICCPRCHPTTPTLWHQLPPSISSLTTSSSPPTTSSSPSPPTTPSPTCPPSQSQSRRSPACRSSWLSPRTALWSRRGRPSSTAQLYTVKRWQTNKQTNTNTNKQMKTSKQTKAGPAQLLS